MLRTIVITMMLFSLSSSQAADNGAGLEAGMVNPGFHDKPSWFKNSFLDLGEDIEEAAEEGKRVILYFHQDGCPYCAKLLNENFTIKKIVEKTTAGFQLIGINMWGDRSVTGIDGSETTEKALAESLKVKYTPTLLFLDEQGRRVLRLNGYYPPHKFEQALDYVAKHEEKRQSYRDYLKKHQSVAASGKLHLQADYLQPPLDLRASARGGDKPLLVLMEMKQCPPCDELHQDILKRPELSKTLQAFDVAVVDVWSSERLITPAGKTVESTKWAEQLGIQYTPSMVLFDSKGEEIFRSEAYLRSFHTHAILDYVLSGSYLKQANFQRYVQARAADMRARGEAVDLME
ncbi:MAG: thioredoxin fold domain-containing protein [Candidatus Thiodiazotropha taylori]|nr:thioredoxin fold domain-containing protein [Candidatus Thiodiazotropha taylori]